MKKYFLSIMLVITHLVGMAQVVQENEAAVVYYMPKTTLMITLGYDMVEEKPGPFYQYAERYLGAREIVTTSKTSYVLTDVSITPYATADTERAYKVTAQKGVQNHLLALSEDGRLLGYNVGLEEGVPPTGRLQSELQDATSSYRLKISGTEQLMPLLEEQFMAGSIAKMAEGAAKQLYRIRETRLNLLAGDMEHVPADGMAMQLVLDELNKQEQALVALFVGTRVVTPCTHIIKYEPKESVSKEVVCRLSQHTGIVDSQDLSGEPIHLTLDAQKQYMYPHVEMDSKPSALSQLAYNLPGHATVTIEYKGKTYVHGVWQVAQYGVAVPMAQEWFIGKNTPSIVLNPETGNIWLIKN